MPCARQTLGVGKGTHRSTDAGILYMSLKDHSGLRHSQWSCSFPAKGQAPNCRCASLIFFPLMKINLHLVDLELTYTCTTTQDMSQSMKLDHFSEGTDQTSIQCVSVSTHHLKVIQAQCWIFERHTFNHGTHTNAH